MKRSLWSQMDDEQHSGWLMGMLLYLLALGLFALTEHDLRSVATIAFLQIFGLAAMLNLSVVPTKIVLFSGTVEFRDEP